MRGSRSSVIAAVLLLGATFAGPAAAASPKPKAKAGAVRDIRIAPKAPKATDVVRVSFTAGAIRPDQRYDVQLSARGAGDACSPGYSVRTHGIARRGRRITVTFDPRAINELGPGVVAGRFCAGDAVVYIGRADAENHVGLAGTASLTIAKDAAYPEPPGTPSRITLLDGSALTVTAPGRPDRVLPVAGVVRGVIPGVFRPNTDITIGAMTGGLWLRSLETDALCAGPAFTTDLPVTPKGASAMLLKASGEATFTLALAADAVSLAGCATPSPAGTTTMSLTGTVTPDGLLRLPLKGTVTGVPIAPNITGTITARLLVNVDLSGLG